MFLKFGDAFLLLTLLSFPLGSGVLDRVVVELIFNDGVLDLPRRNCLVVGVFVQSGQFHLSPTQVVFPEFDDPGLFYNSDGLGSLGLRRPTVVFQGLEVPAVKAVVPFVEGLGCNAEVTAGERDVALGLGFVVDKPVQTQTRGFGEFQELGLLPPMAVLVKRRGQGLLGTPVGFIDPMDEI